MPQISFMHNHNTKRIAYILVVLALWFLMLSIIPVSLPREYTEANSSLTALNSQANSMQEKTSPIMWLIKKGGPIMWILMFTAFVIAVVIPERTVFFWGLSRPVKSGKWHEGILSTKGIENRNCYKRRCLFHHLDMEEFASQLDRLLVKKTDDGKVEADDGNLQKAIDMCDKVKHPVADVFRAGIDTKIEALYEQSNIGKAIDPVKLEEKVDIAMEKESERQEERLEKNLWIVESVSTLAPMLGFLGTIIGLILAFVDWGRLDAMGGNPRITDLAGGMYQAMLTTAAGLVVAIPATLTQIIINHRVKSMKQMMSFYGQKILKVLILPPQK